MNQYNINLATIQILIVDDDPTNIQVAAAHLKTLGIQITYSLTAKEAMKRIEANPPHLILLDIMMPEVDGLTFCKTLKENRQFRDIPIIFLTARIDKETLIEAFNVGGVDYLTKPFHGPELNQRVLNQLRIVDLLQRFESANAELNIQVLKAMKAQEELEKYQKELLNANAQLKELASKDSLTGLLNRRRGWELMEYEAARGDRSNTMASVILLDIDHFKQINDTYGHPEGDRILVEVAELIQSVIRAQDFCIRWGGEEFLIMLPDTGIDGSIVLSKKIQVHAKAKDWMLKDRSVTFSGGCVERKPHAVLEDVIATADELLYKAKTSGRNQILQ